MTKGNGKPCKKCGTSEWYKNSLCVQCQKAHDRKWRQANPERHIEKTRVWQRANPENKAATRHRRHAQKTQAGGSYTVSEWRALCKQYGGRCACCGKKKKLTFDHVVPVSKGGSSDISNGQPLCRSCNASKGNRRATDYRTKPGLLRWIQKRLL